MSDVKWTNGPWTAFETGAFVYINAVNAGFVTTINIRPGRVDECKANVNLIAAAPELYDALDELTHERAALAVEPELDAELQTALRALAKAKGEHHG